MSQDRQTSPISPEAKACVRDIHNYLASTDASSIFDDEISAIIQKLLSSHESKVRREYETLAEKWRKWDDQHCYSGDFASEIESLGTPK